MSLFTFVLHNIDFPLLVFCVDLVLFKRMVKAAEIISERKNFILHNLANFFAL